MLRISCLIALVLCLASISLSTSDSTETTSKKSASVKRSLRYYNFEYTKGDDDYYKRLSKQEKEAVTDDMTFTQKVHKYEQDAKSKFYTIGTTSPKEWSAGEWVFFFFLVILSCCATFLVYGAIFGFRRRLDSPDQQMGYQNMDDARQNRLEFPMRSSRARDEDDDTIMRARSID